MIVFQKEVPAEAMEDFASRLLQYESFDGEPSRTVGMHWPEVEYDTFKVSSVQQTAFPKASGDWQTSVMKALLCELSEASLGKPPAAYKIAYRLRPMITMQQHGCQHCCDADNSGLAFSVTARCRLAFVKKEEFL